ncbi:MAG TPA: ATP-binding protein [Euzebya sp.]|nr:ATP-binding protein [Euzebya sp.]
MTTNQSGEPPALHSHVPAHLAGLELLADPALAVAADGTITYANPQACRLLGEALDQLIGSAAEKKLRLRAADGGDWWQFADPLRADARHLPRIAEQELTLQVGGTARAVALTGARVPNAEGGTDGLVLTLRRAEARRRRDAARSDLVSTVSHELRSPLTSVKGFTKTLLAKWDRFTDDQKKQMLATVNEDADRVTRLLGELLAVSRIDAGRLQLKRQMVSLDVLIPRVVDRVQAGRVGPRRTIAVTIGEVPDLYADPDKLEQVLSNLLENAIKYTLGPITVAADEEDDHVTVSITDVGEGIEPENQAAIFTKFFRRPGEKRQGTGLGLYITKGLVEAHGGEIWVTSESGAGSVFSFTVPKGGLELAGIDLDALRASVTTSSAPDHDS